MRLVPDAAIRAILRRIVTSLRELLAAVEAQALPTGVTAHKLRHTFASILAALSEPMPYVMAQLGHADPKFTLRVYAHAMRRGDDERKRLVGLVGRNGDEAALVVGEAIIPPVNA